MGEIADKMDKMIISVEMSIEQANDIREWVSEQLENNIEIEYYERLVHLLETIDEAEKK